MSLGEYLGAGSGITKGLYHLNGNPNDVSGNAYNGVDTSVSYSPAYGKLGQGSLYNGLSSNTNLGAHLPAAAGTILWWMRPVSIVSGRRPWSDLGGYLFCEFNASNQMRILLFDGAAKNTSYVGLSTAIRDFWAVTWNSVNVYLYKSGSQVASVAAGAISNVTNALSIGGISTTFANVEVDEFILENTAWSAQKIQKFYTQAIGRFGG